MGIYVIVAFKTNEENAIYYKKCKSMEELKKALEIAFEVKDADFVSIRNVKKSEEVCREASAYNDHQNENEKGKEKASLMKFLNSK